MRIRDVYPGSWFLPIPDPGSGIPDPKIATKRGDQKKNHSGSRIRVQGSKRHRIPDPRSGSATLHFVGFCSSLQHSTGVKKKLKYLILLQCVLVMALVLVLVMECIWNHCLFLFTPRRLLTGSATLAAAGPGAAAGAAAGPGAAAGAGALARLTPAGAALTAGALTWTLAALAGTLAGTLAARCFSRGRCWGCEVSRCHYTSYDGSESTLNI